MIINLRNIEKILPSKKLLGDYSETEIALIRSYYILSHAEFEFFFEECATKKINSVLKEFNKHSTPHVALLSLTFAFIKADTDVLEAKKIADIKHLLNIVRTKYQKNVIESNHGIKEKNLVDIFSPIGVDIYSIFDISIIGDLNTLGSKRGDFAHKGLHVNLIEDIDSAKARTHKLARNMRKFYSFIDTM